MRSLLNEALIGPLARAHEKSQNASVYSALRSLFDVDSDRVPEVPAASVPVRFQPVSTPGRSC